jgi:hypothetical protein
LDTDRLGRGKLAACPTVALQLLALAGASARHVNLYKTMGGNQEL